MVEMVLATIKDKRNWAGTREYKNVKIYLPTNEDEVSNLVKSYRERGRKLKPMGEGLSFSDSFAPHSHGDIISLEDMSNISIDKDRKQISVQAGAKLMDLHDPLYKKGLSLDNFGSIVMQATGGYTGTGSHGTGLGTQILSAQIDKMTLVDGQGDVHYLNKDSKPELFSAARVHLGALGVVTEMTFNCVDAFDLEERLEVVDFDKALSDIKDYTDPQKNLYCKFWWLPYTDKMLVYGFNKTDKPHTRMSLNEYMDAKGISGKAFSGLIRFTDRFPGTSKLIHNIILNASFQPHRRVDRSDKIIKYIGEIPIHDETEYAIDVSKAAEAIDKLRKLVEKAPYHVNFMTEVRFCAGDDIPMSPTYGRPTCYLGAYTGLKTADAYTKDFEDMIRDYKGRPHWGKQFSRTSDDFRELYPQFNEFNKLREKHDPQGLFRNSFVDRVFGLE